MVRVLTIQSHTTLVLGAALAVALVISLPSRPASAQANSYPLSYSGRLTLPGGEPMQGPVDIELRFWDAATDGNTLSRAFKTAGAPLNQGVFQLRIPLTDSEVSEVFGDGTKPVYVEITAKDTKYPRQEFSYTPLALRALRTPIDNKTLNFTSDGKLKVEVPSRPSSNSVLVIDSQGKFNWEPLTVTQSGSGTTSLAITAGAGLNGGTITNSGTISLAATGVTPGTYAKAQLIIDSTGRVTSAVSGAPTDLATEVTGTLPVGKGGTGATSLTVNSVLVGNGTGALQTVAPGASGNVLTSNGSSWLSAPAPQANATTTGYLTASDWSAFSQKQSAGNYLTGLTGDLTTSSYSSGAATATLANVALPGSATKVTYDVKGRVTEGTTLAASDIPPLNAATITSGTLPLALGGTGANLTATGGTGQYLKQTMTGGAITVGTIPASDITLSLGYMPLNKAGDTMSGSLNTGGFDIDDTGNIQMAAAKTLGLGIHTTDPVALGAGDNGKIWFNSTSNQIKYWNGSSVVTLGAAGSGLSSLNGQTGNNQTFSVPGTAGNAPSWQSSGNAHTLNIPMASAASVTAGLLSNTDYAAFTSKVSNVAQGNGIAISSAGGTATVSLANAGASGNYAKVTTDIYGRVTSGTTLVDADLPPHSAGLITAGTLNVANGGTGAISLAVGNVILGNGTSPLQAVAPGTNGNVLTSNGTTWQSTALPPSVTSVSGASPITVTGATTPVVAITQASASTDGYLSSVDWNTFNTKQASGSYIAQLDGDLTLSGYTSGTATANLASVALAGTAAKVTYDVKGRVTSGTTLSASDIPVLSANHITTSLGYTPLNRSGDVMSGPLNMGASDITNTGNLHLASSSEVRFIEAGANGTNYVGFKAPSAIAADKVWMLPAADGSAGQVLKTDGAGNLGWVTAAVSGGSGGTITDATITDDDIATTANIADSKLATISTAGKVSGSAITAGTIGGATTVNTTGNLITSGNIGIGTTNPAGKLDVAGTICLSGANCISSWPAGSVTAVNAGTGLTGGPITSSGSLALANTAVTPGAYTRANITVDAQGRLTAASSGNNVSLTTEVAGTLPIASGGTGATTAASAFNALSPLTTIGDLLYAGASGAGTRLAGNTTSAKQFLTSTGASGLATAPVWATLSAGDLPVHSAALITSGTLGVANGGTGATSLAANNVLLGNGTSAPMTVAPGANGNILTSNGSTWVSSAPSGGSWTASGSDVYRGGGNVGIGTTSPISKLTVGDGVGAPNGLATLNLTGANTTPQNSTRPGFYHRHMVGLGVFSDVGISFEVNGNTSLTEAMRIDNGGRVGIGTSAPSAVLQTVANISGALPANSGTSQTGAEFRMSSSGGATLDFGTKSDGLQWIQATNVSDLSLKYPLTLNPNGGNVGIATTAPAATLDIVGKASASDGFGTLIQSSQPANNFTGIGAANTWYATGETLTITVPAGGPRRYRIVYRQLAVNGNWGTMWIGLSTANPVSNGLIMQSASYMHPGQYQTLNGEMYVTLSGGTTTTYYMGIYITNTPSGQAVLNGSGNGRNYCDLFAVQM